MQKKARYSNFKQIFKSITCIMFNILMFIAFSTQQRNEVHNTCCVFLSNINLMCSISMYLRDYFVMKQNKKTPLCSTSLGMNKNNLCTSHCIYSSLFGIIRNHELNKEHLKIVAFLFPMLSPCLTTSRNAAFPQKVTRIDITHYQKKMKTINT